MADPYYFGDCVNKIMNLDSTRPCQYVQLQLALTPAYKDWDPQQDETQQPLKGIQMQLDCNCIALILDLTSTKP